MNKLFSRKLKGILLVFFGLLIVLVPFSLLVGWNFLTLVLFWFVIVPGAAIKLPTLLPGRSDHLSESFVGLLLFYAFMVFMTYKLYQTGYFQVMALSFIISLTVFFVLWKEKTKAIQA